MKTTLTLIIGTIAFIAILVWGNWSRQKPKLFTITTTEWTVIELKTKSSFQIVESDYENLKWFVSGNDVNHPVEMPPKDNKRVDLGYNVKRLYVCLKPGQSRSVAQVKIQKAE